MNNGLVGWLGAPLALLTERNYPELKEIYSRNYIFDLVSFSQLDVVNPLFEIILSTYD